MGQSRQTDSQSPSTGSSGVGNHSQPARHAIGGTGRQVRSVDHPSTRRSATSAPPCDVSAPRRCRFTVVVAQGVTSVLGAKTSPDLVIALCTRLRVTAVLTATSSTMLPSDTQRTSQAHLAPSDQEPAFIC
jgi:hypothetical protein